MRPLSTLAPFCTPSFLVATPSECAWQALKEESRLWVLQGLVEVFAARAALLGSAPPQVEKLLGMVGGAKFLGWYVGGAYCEAVMRTVRRMQFINAYGQEEGERRWWAWYTGCKSSAGAAPP